MKSFRNLARPQFFDLAEDLGKSLSSGPAEVGFFLLGSS
jgi:hypothetical protein